MLLELSWLSFGIGIGGLIFFGFHRLKFGSYQALADQMLLKAELKVQELKNSAALELEKEKSLQRLELEKTLFQRKKEEETHKTELKSLDKQKQEIEKGLRELKKKELALKEKETCLNLELEKVSGLSLEEARQLTFKQVEDDVKKDVARFLARTQQELEEESESRAQKILAATIQRLAVPSVSEVTVQTVTLPSDDLKGRIIGREGRNIRTLEHLTGITLILDETPGAIVLSGFDPIRMQVAKLALIELINDGRIHPTRIEEAVERAKIKVNQLIKKYGEDASIRAGVIPIHPELAMLLGKLKFRFSYGQNMLEHSLEVSSLMGMIAEELGLNAKLARRIGLLHDIGKALTHEMEGTHAIIGHDIALRFGEKPEVANGIGCHHNEISPTTIEASLCSAADAISASRPGARLEAVEEYLKRLKNLETLALSFQGVDKAYAVQAGREIRVIVTPEEVDDDGVLLLARDLTKRIEKELRYPGKIKVTVIREKRAIQYAI